MGINARIGSQSRIALSICEFSCQIKSNQLTSSSERLHIVNIIFYREEITK